MKRMFLFLSLFVSCVMAYGQHSIFMQILENKKICNKEDELTYFLQAKSFDRANEDHYYHRYAVNGEFYTTCIINRNECYVVYQTDNAKDYNKIKAAIASLCDKELAADKSVSYICNSKRIQDVQVIFSGYLQAEKVYEIMVYQNPDQHEAPYNQSDRIRTEEPVAKKKAVKKKKIVSKSAAPKTAEKASVVPAKSEANPPAAAAKAEPKPATAKPVQGAPKIIPASKKALVPVRKEIPVMKQAAPSVKK